MRRWALLLVGILLADAPRAGADDLALQRARMVAEVRDMARQVGGRGGEIAPEVYEVLARVPRHLFVPEGLRGQAYRNAPLAIGGGQTISQPYIVALMTHLVGAGPGARILEIGTGSGYQAAILAAIGAEVYTIEIVPELGARAAEVLAENGYAARTRIGDGYQGWPEAAPFDGILVTAAPEHVPQPLIDQLKSGGRMVIPVGPADGAQKLYLMQKKQDGKLEREIVIPVSFVPLTGTRR